MLEHYVRIVEDLVVEFVRAVVAVLRKLLLAHLVPMPLLIVELAVAIVFVRTLFTFELTS